MKKTINIIGSIGFTMLVGFFFELLLTFGTVVEVPVWEWHWFAVLMQIFYILTLLWIWVNIYYENEKS